MNITPETTVGALVAERLGRSRVFERYGIDFCCGGKEPLVDACGRLNLDVAAVSEALREDDRLAQGPDPLGELTTLSELITHLLESHHAYLRNDLPRLTALADKVARVHGENHPELAELRAVVHAFTNDMLPHLDKEEQILFPLIIQIDAGTGNPRESAEFLPHPIARMEAEHLDAGACLERMRQLTDGFQVPEDACTSYRVLFDGLKDLEIDTHLHIHKESNILFPKAAEKATAGVTARA